MSKGSCQRTGGKALRYMAITIVIGVIALELAGCISSKYIFARVRQGEVLVDDQGAPEMDESRHIEDAQKAVTDLMEAKGYEIPSEMIKDRTMIRNAAKITGIFAIIALGAWFTTKLRELGGFAALMAVISISCFGLGQVIRLAYIPVCFILLAGLLALGWKIKDKGLEDLFRRGRRVPKK